MGVAERMEYNKQIRQATGMSASQAAETFAGQSVFAGYKDASVLQLGRRLSDAERKARERGLPGALVT